MDIRSIMSKKVDDFFFGFRTIIINNVSSYVELTLKYIITIYLDLKRGSSALVIALRISSASVSP